MFVIGLNGEVGSTGQSGIAGNPGRNGSPGFAGAKGRTGATGMTFYILCWLNMVNSSVNILIYVCNNFIPPFAEEYAQYVL